MGSSPGCTDPGTNLPMPCGACPELFMMCCDAELVLRNTFIRITLLTRLMRLQLLLVVLLFAGSEDSEDSGGPSQHGSISG